MMDKEEIEYEVAINDGKCLAWGCEEPARIKECKSCGEMKEWRF